MSAPRHTPGPWHCTSERDSVTGQVSTQPVGYGSYGDIAMTFGVGAKINARLIAAAPDLLEKCEKIVRWLDKLAARSEESAKDRRFVSLSDAHQADAKNYRATADDIRAVIAKATGGEA